MSSASASSIWTCVGDRCFVQRYESFDLSVSVVLGEQGAMLVDTRSSSVEGEQLVADLRRLTDLPLLAVVNTHQHFDHTFGNDALAAAYGAAPIVAHESVPLTLPDHAESIRAQIAAAPDEDERYGWMLATPVRLPDTTFSAVWSIDLGDCYVEAMHPGRGHTEGDIVIRVPGSDVVFAGDLVEQSGPPSYGPDCWPLDWPLTLDQVLGLLTPASVVVPGHGDRVDKEFVEQLRADVSQVAEQLRALSGDGLSVEAALTRGDWPMPSESLRVAVERGLVQLSG